MFDLVHIFFSDQCVSVTPNVVLDIIIQLDYPSIELSN